jgi:hypothetical protein
LFHPKAAFQRYVRLGEIEMVRNVYVAVRQAHWVLLSPQSQLRKWTLWKDAPSKVDCEQTPIDLHWNGSIIATPGGTIRFNFEGIARSGFLRAGLEKMKRID